MKLLAFAAAVSANCLIKGLVLPTPFQTTPERAVIVIDNSGARVVTDPENRRRGLEQGPFEVPSDFSQLPIHTTVNVEGEHITVFAKTPDQVTRIIPKLKPHLCGHAEYAPMFPTLCQVGHAGGDKSPAQRVTTSFTPTTASAVPGRHGTSFGDGPASLTTAHRPDSAVSEHTPISTRFSFNTHSRSRASGRPTTRRTAKNANSQKTSASSTAGSLSNGKPVSRSTNHSDSRSRPKGSSQPNTSLQATGVDDERKDQSTSTTASSPSMTAHRSASSMDTVNSGSTGHPTSTRQSLANGSHILTVTTPSSSSRLLLPSDTANRSRTTVVPASTELRTALPSSREQTTGGASTSTASQSISSWDSQLKTTQSTERPLDELTTSESSTNSGVTSEAMLSSDSRSRSTTTMAAAVTPTGHITATKPTQSLLSPTRRTSRSRHTGTASTVVTTATATRQHSPTYLDPSSSQAGQQTTSSNPSETTGYKQLDSPVSVSTTPEWPKELTGPITVWPYTTGISYGRRFLKALNGAVSTHSTGHNVQNEDAFTCRQPLQKGELPHGTEHDPAPNDRLSVPEPQSLRTVNSSETANKSRVSKEQAHAGGHGSCNATQQECDMLSSWGVATYCGPKGEAKNIVRIIKTAIALINAMLGFNN